jgi:hypothetical protein
MALFTDGPASTIEDLTAQDSQVLNIAASEGIDLTVKLRLTNEMVGMDLEELLRRASGFDLSHVVVTSPVRLWHTYRTLENVYRDAYNNQLNDRYAGKRDQFRELSKWAYDRLVQAGIGIALQPVPRAATPDVRQTLGGVLPDGLYYVTMAWINSAGDSGVCANPGTILVTGSGFRVEPQAAPAGVAGWNVFVGMDQEAMWRQNAEGIAPDAPWIQSGGWLSEGVVAGKGQNANYFHPIPRVLQRG